MTWSKLSSSARGYGAAWQKLRLQVLERDGFICQCPKCLGGKLRLRPATHVDHIKPKAQGGLDSLDNLRALNADCHRRVSAEQRGHTLKPRQAFDINGEPTRWKP